MEESFISNWALVADLQELEKDPHQPVYSKTATHFLENYKFPVMMILALSNGTILHKVNANDFMHTAEGQSSPSMMESFFSLFSGDQGLIPTKKVTTQRPELFREMRNRDQKEIPEEQKNEHKYLEFLKEGVKRAQFYQ